MLKPNRAAAAWTIAIPLAAILLAAPGLSRLIPNAPSEAETMLANVFTSLAFGTAAVWLLSPQLQHRLRFVVFLKMTATCAVFGAFACFVRSQWRESVASIMEITFFTVLVLVTIGALSLSGLLARRRYRPVFLIFSLATLIAVILLVIALPFFLVGTGGRAAWTDFFAPLLSIAGACFIALLPFVLFAFVSRFFRGRLKSLLKLETDADWLNGIPVASSPSLTQPMERTSV